MGNNLLVFFLLFINLYFPINPVLITGIDIIFAFWYCKNTQIAPFLFLIISSFLLLFTSIISFVAADAPEYQVIFKYIRTFISTIAIITIAQKIELSPKPFVRLISIVLCCHLIAIVLQIIHPPLGPIMAPYFNFTRKISFLETIQLRKLGLCGGYDAASMILASSLIFYYLNYIVKKNIVFFILALTSVFLTLFVSRLGMALSTIILFCFSIYSIRKKGAVRATGVALMLVVLFFATNILLPILANTNSLLINISTSSANDISYFTQDYRSTNGSVEALTNEHLIVYKNLDFFQLIFGAGNSSESDIGYIQLLFQVGLTGLFIIIMMHIWATKRTIYAHPINEDMKILQLFCVFYIILLSIFNYKILLLYSRGFYDFYILCFVYYITTQKKLEKRFINNTPLLTERL